MKSAAASSLRPALDFLVLGGGSAGLAAARRAALSGRSVALLEQSRLGGTCVNLGCIPKKVMFNAAHFLTDLHALRHGYGLLPSEPIHLDWPTLKRSRDAFIQRLNSIYARNLAQAGIQFIQGTASFVEPKVIRCGDQFLTAKHILIATGSTPHFPSDVEGIEHAHPSDHFFDLEQPPRRVLVVGSGYIGVELSGVLAAFGSDVTLTGRGARILRAFDSEIACFVQENMARLGVNFRLECQPVQIAKTESGRYSVTFSNCPDPEPYDLVIYTVGRVANTQALQLEIPGVAVNSKGFVKADALHNTNIEGIYALGDVSGEVMLTPVAVKAGRTLADRLFSGSQAVMDYQNVPTVIFSHPPIGSVGLSEEQAVQKYGQQNIKVYRSKSVNTFFGPSEVKEQTLMKVICLLPEERVVGLWAAGRSADEIVQGFAVAVKMGATKADLDSVVAIHPTASEELVLLR